MAGHAQLDAAKRIGLDQVHEFPANCAGRQPFFDAANAHRRNEALKEASNGAFHTDVHLRDAHFDISVGAMFGKIDVIHADNFSPVRVDNLLVEEIFADGKPRFIGLIELEGGLVGAEFDPAGGDGCNLVVAGDDRPVLAAAEEKTRDAIRLVGRLDEHFFDAADEVSG